ncbi:MAG: glycosyl transferase family 2 [Candidatus Nomurabacteria bacterium]|nr:glycosyl transferase family 2 [Candidatus Nomurabacteria bacterium]
MKFSIVIPALNEANWIKKSLAAVLAQTYTNFEVIVVNNNSTDSTKEVVQEFINTNPQVRLIDCPTPGILHARNCGLSAATGDIIVQLDADNIPSKNWLANAAKHFQKEHVVALGGAYDYYDANLLFRYVSLLVQWVTLPLGNWYVQKRHYGAFLIGGNAFIKKWVLDDMHGYDTNHTFCSEDLVTAREVAKRGYVKFCFDLQIKSSARRHKQLGYFFVQRQYNMGTSAVLRGLPIPRQQEETHHPR